MLINAGKMVILFLVSVFTLFILEWILPGFEFKNFLTASAGIILLALLNTFLRPFLVRVTMRINAITYGVFSLLISALMVWMVSWIIPEFHVRGLLTGLAIVLGLTFTNTIFTEMLYSKEDRQLQEFNRIKKLIRKVKNTGDTSTPGLIILEIDGLSYPVLHKAIEDGYMPHFAEWLSSGKYKVTEWDSGLPSQTSAMQAGILHGSHHNIPAFRFYDKKTKHLYVSGNGKDAGNMLRPILNGQGILGSNGFSVNNWAYGDAPAVLMTFTTMTDKALGASAQADNLYSYLASPENLPRTMGGAIREIFRERREARYQRKHETRPLIHRSGIYPFMRAGTNVFLPDLARSLVVTKMFEGISAVYSTFLAYDEVAHHSGVIDRDVWPVLHEIDEQFAWIVEASKHTQRPYEFIFLSDHGQSPGITFKQRYGKSLKDHINSLLSPEYQAAFTSGGDSGDGHVDMLLTSIIKSNGMLARPMRNLLKNRTRGGVVETTIPGVEEAAMEAGEVKTVVCASGNLALIYFTDLPERLTAEDIAGTFPGFLLGLVAHEGVGFALVHSSVDGALVVGKNGIYYLDTDKIEGENPLANFGPRAAQHLRELDTYPNVGDIVLNSFYDPATGEVAPFEELNGTHGGLGGWQNHPFLMYPAHLEPEGGMPEVIGAPGVYKHLRRWITQLQHLDMPESVASSVGNQESGIGNQKPTPDS